MKFEREVIELLKEDSFPSMIMIDGAWGSGKTYYVKATLIDRLKQEFKGYSINYFSLYGLHSVQDFRDKVVSLSVFKNENTHSYNQHFHRLVDGISKYSGEKGVGAAISGLSGALNQRAFSGVKNKIFILDDIERLADEKLIKSLLGESFNLVENNINIKVIVVTNSKALNCIEDIEKVFVDRVEFSVEFEEIIELLKSEFSGILTKTLENCLLSVIVDLNLKNIRILKRALTKFKRLHYQIKADPDVFTERAFPVLLEHVVRLCNAHLGEGYSEGEISEFNPITYILSQKNKDELDEKTEILYKLLKCIENSSYNKMLVSYCCRNLFEFDDVVRELDLPRRTHPLENMLSIGHQALMSNSEFEDGLALLRDFIKSEKDLEVYKWFKACDTYLYMLTHNMVLSADLHSEMVLGLCRDIHASSFKAINGKLKDFTDIGNKFNNNEIAALYNKTVAKIFNHTDVERNVDIFKRFDESWVLVNMEIYTDWQTKPLLNLLGAERIMAAFKNWRVRDLYYFSASIRSRYNISNLEQFFSAELDVIDQLIRQLHEWIEALEIDRKLVILNEIKTEFERVRDQMTANLEK